MCGISEHLFFILALKTIDDSVALLFYEAECLLVLHRVEEARATVDRGWLSFMYRLFLCCVMIMLSLQRIDDTCLCVCFMSV